MTRSSPKLSDLLSDPDIGRSLCGAWFHFFEILLLQETEFLQISHHENFQSVGGLCPKTKTGILGSQFITNEDHLLTLGVEFVSPPF